MVMRREGATNHKPRRKKSSSPDIKIFKFPDINPLALIFFVKIL